MSELSETRVAAGYKQLTYSIDSKIHLLSVGKNKEASVSVRKVKSVDNLEQCLCG